jgi:hypothetical protein
MELLAIRLSWQTTPAKSLVMQGGGDKEPNGIFGMPQNQFATEHTEKVVADFTPRGIDELLLRVGHEPAHPCLPHFSVSSVFSDKTPSHSTKPASGQVAGYVAKKVL